MLRQPMVRARALLAVRVMFAILFPYQKELIEALCWGDGCGKGNIGAIDIGHSMAVGCNEETCPFEVKRSDCIGTLGSDDTEKLYIRVIGEPKAAAPVECPWCKINNCAESDVVDGECQCCTWTAAREAADDCKSHGCKDASCDVCAAAEPL